MSKLCKIYNKESTQAPHHRPFMRGYHPWPLDFAHKRTMVQNTMTSSNGNIFRVIGHLCGEFTGPRRIPLTKAIDVGLWCFFDLRLNKQFSKQSWGWWFETQSRSLWGHCNEAFTYHVVFRLAHIYGSAEGPPRVAENRNLLSHPDDLRKEAYLIRMT